MKNSTKIFIMTFAVFTLIFNSNSYSQLNGNYVIGNGGDYPTINSAVVSLINQGVNGPVTFNIKPGKYYESVTVDSVKGTSPLNTVTFQSHSGVANTVRWFNNSAAGYSYILRINKADYIIFRNITFSGDSAGINSRTLIDINDYSAGISFLYNVFKTDNYKAPSTILIYSDASYIENLRISNNSFLATGVTNNYTDHEGIILECETSSLSTQITSNKFTDLSSSIEVSNSDSLQIDGNTIQMGNSMNTNFGVYLFNCNALKLLKNKINSAYSCAVGEAIGYSLLITHSENTLIANNFILFTGGAVAVLAISNSNQRYKYNTIASFGGDCPNNLFIFNSNSITLQNNIYVNFNTNTSYPGSPYNIFNSEINSEHNNFYYDAQYIAKYNGLNLNGIDEWREVSGADFESDVRTVDFVSNLDLHLDDSSINDYSLKGIPDSEVADDFDGNPRDPFFPSMGADEPFYPLNIYVILTLFIEGFYDPIMNYQPQDTIKVYLRNNTNPYNIIDSCVSPLLPGGKSAIRFFNAPPGNYYLSVKHRNSLETWSRTGGESFNTGGSSTYDFTNSITKAYGNNLTLKGHGFCLYSGDVDQNGAIDLTDVLEVYNNSFSFLSGYEKSDLNGDSEVDLTDVLIVYNNSVKFIGLRRP